MTTRMHRKIALGLVVPLAGLVGVGCQPTPPPCPTLAQGNWVGTWSSNNFPGAGGDVTATISTSGSNVTGTVQLTGAVVSGGPVTGRIDCGNLTLERTDGSIQVAAGISPDGRKATGLYNASLPDVGAIQLIAK